MSTNTPDTPHRSEVRPWSPWRDVVPWGMRFDDLVDQLWSGFPARGDLTPAAALHEEDKAYVVEPTSRESTGRTSPSISQTVG